MKVVTIIDENTTEERIEIYAKRPCREIEAIKKIAEGAENALIGYADDGSFKVLDPNEILCLTIVAGKLTAKTKCGTFEVKKRLYEAEEFLSDQPDFHKISQNCIVNLKKIDKFEVCYNGTIVCKFQNGDAEYVSRRFIKKLKERLGI